MRGREGERGEEGYILTVLFSRVTGLINKPAAQREGGGGGGRNKMMSHVE